MRYCSTWLRSLLCYIKKFVIEEFVIRVFHCIKNNIFIYYVKYLFLISSVGIFEYKQKIHMLTFA